MSPDFVEVKSSLVLLLNNCKSLICDQNDLLKRNGLLENISQTTFENILKEINEFVQKFSENHSEIHDIQNKEKVPSVVENLKRTSDDLKFNDTTKRTAILRENSEKMEKLTKNMTSKEILCSDNFDINSSNAELINSSLQLVLENMVREVKHKKEKHTCTGIPIPPTRPQPEPIYKYKCEYCKKMFRTRPEMKKHNLEIHFEDRPYPCSKCELKFRQIHNLKDHMLVHTGEKPFKCDFCQKRFRQRGTLNTHRRVHTGEKPFKCKICDAAFSNQSSLIFHVRSQHTFEKPFLCDLCSSNFTTKSMFSDHMRRHNGIKPYLCTECPQRFVNMTGLKRHNLTHTDQKPFSCEFCSASFRQRCNLRGHIRRLHLKREVDSN